MCRTVYDTFRKTIWQPDDENPEIRFVRYAVYMKERPDFPETPKKK
jgi:hypothetical protein